MAREQCKIKLIEYFRTSPLIPRKTGRLIESAVSHILASGLGDSFELDIWFDTPYAKIIETEKLFLEKILPQIKQIVKDTQLQVYAQFGLQAEVIIA